MQIDTEIENIIKTDYQKNHQGRNYSVDAVLDIFDNIEQTKYSTRRYGKVIVVYKPFNATTVEFHCTNGGNSKDIIEAVNQFNKEMVDSYIWSVTFYDNPKINELLKHSFCPSDFTKIDKGVDKTYMAKFSLRGISWDL